MSNASATSAPDRAHAVLSASGYKKWSTCTMAPALEEKIPEEDSPWAREGTYAHEVAEALTRCWLSGNDGADVERASALMDPEQNPDAEEFFSQDLLDFVNVHVNQVIDAVTSLREVHGEDKVLVLLEQRLNFSRWVPEGFGTGDVVIVYPGGVWVIDLKYGVGVRVSDTGQLRLYALGALERYDLLYDIQEVTVTITQPRMDNIITETHAREELLHWADELVVPRARIAWAAYKGDRSQARFSPGEHCTKGFCKARFTCSARARYMLEAAEQPFAKGAPDTLSVEQLESVVDRARLAVKWLSDCERYLTSQAIAGKVTLLHHNLVPGRTQRVITDEDKAAKALMSNGFRAADIYAEPKLRGLMALERLAGGPRKFQELLGDLLVKPEGEPTLARKVDEAPSRSRKGVPSASDDFADCTDD